MRVLIVEDEPLSAERLRDLLTAYDAGIEIVAAPESVAETVAWLRTHRPPDLAFFDIRLADGLSFEIFEQCEVTCPVIFTTAYDAYALQAFQVYSVDYLLKPIDPEGLARSFAKLDRLRGPWQKATLAGVRQLLTRRHKHRFLVKQGDHLLTLPVEEVKAFSSVHKVTWLHQDEGRKHAVGYTLEQLEGVLDPARFFRVNRQYLVAIDAIGQIADYGNNRLKIAVKGLPGKETWIVVSRDRVPAFREWLEGEGG